MFEGVALRLLLREDDPLMEKHFLTLADISAYTISFQLSNEAWDVVSRWGFFEKDTIGKQFVRSIDSISANIAEGFGRYGKREKAQFFHYSLGSVHESIDWNNKAHYRGLITQDRHDHFQGVLSSLPREIHSLIQYYNARLEH